MNAKSIAAAVVKALLDPNVPLTSIGVMMQEAVMSSLKPETISMKSLECQPA